MNDVQKNCSKRYSYQHLWQRRPMRSVAVFFLLALLSGCGSAASDSDPADSLPLPDMTAGPEADAAPGKEESMQPGLLQNFHQDDVRIVPEVPIYPLNIAEELGSVQKLHGMLPGSCEGTWYTAEVDGVEYYYGTYDLDDPGEPLLYGYAIFSDAYALANGITTGMTETEILASYPDMAVMDFEGNFLQKAIGNMGWNPAAYPRSYLDMDVSFDYGGKDYLWSDRFDHLLIAEVDNDATDTLPSYLALLIKEHAVAAITFYYPTAN